MVEANVAWKIVLFGRDLDIYKKKIILKGDALEIIHAF
jgi:hypothetical protein